MIYCVYTNGLIYNTSETGCLHKWFLPGVPKVKAKMKIARVVC